MKSTSVWFVLLCVVQIATAFSITNELNIGNLTATPELTMNISDSSIDISINEFNISNANETLNFDTSNIDRSTRTDTDRVIQNDHNNYSISQSAHHHTGLIVSNEHWRNSILKHQSRTSRSFLGLFIIPC